MKKIIKFSELLEAVKTDAGLAKLNEWIADNNTAIHSQNIDTKIGQIIIAAEGKCLEKIIIALDGRAIGEVIKEAIVAKLETSLDYSNLCLIEHKAGRGIEKELDNAFGNQIRNGNEAFLRKLIGYNVEGGDLLLSRIAEGKLDDAIFDRIASSTGSELEAILIIIKQHTKQSDQLAQKLIVKAQGASLTDFSVVATNIFSGSKLENDVFSALLKTETGEKLKFLLTAFHIKFKPSDVADKITHTSGEDLITTITSFADCIRNSFSNKEMVAVKDAFIAKLENSHGGELSTLLKASCFLRCTNFSDFEAVYNNGFLPIFDKTPTTSDDLGILLQNFLEGFDYTVSQNATSNKINTIRQGFCTKLVSRMVELDAKSLELALSFGAFRDKIEVQETAITETIISTVKKAVKDDDTSKLGVLSRDKNIRKVVGNNDDRFEPAEIEAFTSAQNAKPERAKVVEQEKAAETPAKS